MKIYFDCRKLEEVAPVYIKQIIFELKKKTAILNKQKEKTY